MVDEKSVCIIPIVGSAFLHFKTFPTMEGVSLPESTSASMILVSGGRRNGDTLWFQALFEGDKVDISVAPVG